MNKLLNTTSTWFDILCTVKSLSNSVAAYNFDVVKYLVNFNVAN